MDIEATTASNPPHVWKDVTELFKKAASEMTNQVPMLHTEEFSLLESMSAVEIMDPIMDQCCGLKGTLRESEIYDVTFPDEGVPLSTVVKLFQSLFIYEAAFQDGASLMESINRCIFSWEGAWPCLEKRANVVGSAGLPERAILAYCKSLVFTTGCQFKSVMAADIYEDEDFQPGYKNFLFDRSLNSEAISSQLESVIVELEEMDTKDSVVAYLLQTLKTRLQMHTFSHLMGWWVQATITEYARLLKQRNANNAAAAARSEGADSSSSSSSSSSTTTNSTNTEAATSAEAALAVSLVAARKRAQQGCIKIKSTAVHTVAALQLLIDLHASHAADAATEGPSSIYSDITHPAACPEIEFALSSNIVKLHQTGPIRRVAMKPFSSSLLYVQSIVREVLEISGTVMSLFSAPIVSSVAQAHAVQVAAVASGNPHRTYLTLDSLLHTTLGISQSCLHLYTRCYYTAALYVLSPELSSIIWASMHAKGLPKALIESELVATHWVPANPCVAVWDTLKGLVVCRSRLLSSRLQNILDLWNVVANEAIFVDGRFHSDLYGADNASPGTPPTTQWCSLWALQNMVYVMDLYMSLMVECDLVGLEEWDYFFWYWDYLCNTGIFTAEKLRSQRYELDKDMYDHAVLDLAKIKLQEDAKKKGGAKNKKKGTDAAPPASAGPLPPAPVLAPASAEELLLKGRGMLCRGLYRMCTLAGTEPAGLGLNARGQPLLDKSEGRYSSWEVKFTHRFQPFAELSNPPHLSYSDFTRNTGRAADGNPAAPRDTAFLNNLVQGAQSCFQNARKSFDEARAAASASTGSGGAPSSSGSSGAGKEAGDKLVQAGIVALTKTSVASALSAMRVAQMLKEPPAVPASASSARSYALAVNRTYSKHFPVLEFSVNAISTVAAESK